MAKPESSIKKLIVITLLLISPILRILFLKHYILTVKVHGVFPSSRKYSVSSRKIQFRWANAGDSKEVVTPFMHDGTYPSRNFATLGPSELQPPFTVGSIRSLKTSPIYFTVPGRRQTLYIVLQLCRVLCF